MKNLEGTPEITTSSKIKLEDVTKEQWDELERKIEDDEDLTDEEKQIHELVRETPDEKMEEIWDKIDGPPEVTAEETDKQQQDMQENQTKIQLEDLTFKQIVEIYNKIEDDEDLTDEEKQIHELVEGIPEGELLNKLNEAHKLKDEREWEEYLKNRPESRRAHEKAMQEKFSAHETINEIAFSVTYVNPNGYEIYFPKIDKNSGKAAENKINGQVLIIGRSPDFAKDVFEYTKTLAALDNNDVHDIFTKVEKFINEKGE